MTRNLLSGRSSSKKRYNDKPNTPTVINVQPISDVVLIEPIIPGNIIVGHENGLKSSDVSIDNILNKMRGIIPPPLKSGNNVKIVDNKINAVMYDDSCIRDEIDKNYHTLTATIGENHKYCKSSNDDIYVVMNKLAGNYKQVCEQYKELSNKYNSNIEHCNERHIESNVMFGKTIIKMSDEISDTKIECNDKLIEFQEHINTISDQIEILRGTIDENAKKSKTSVICLNDKSKMLDNKVDIEISKIQDTHQTEIDDLKKQLKEQVDYNAKLYEELSNMSSRFNVVVDSKIEKIISNQDVKLNEFIKSNNVITYNMQQTIDNLLIQIHKLENINPDSKTVQKLIKQLTSKCNKLGATK